MSPTSQVRLQLRSYFRVPVHVAACSALRPRRAKTDKASPVPPPADQRLSPGLTLNLESKNPFRIPRTNSPGLLSPAFPSPRVNSPRPSTATNPFLSAFEQESEAAQQAQQPASSMEPPITGATPRPQADSDAAQLFVSLSLPPARTLRQHTHKPVSPLWRHRESQSCCSHSSRNGCQISHFRRAFC
jgi:hypothetical protein